MDSLLTLYFEGDNLKISRENQDLLRTILIVSQLNVKDLESAEDSAEDLPDNIKGKALVEKAPGKKCSRCWITYKKLSGSAEHPELCSRCLEVVEATANQ